MSRDFKIVDVFSSTPLKGNPVAVVLDADGLNTTQMQAIAGWANLSETTFLLPPTQPGATYKLRIFSPRNELDFAGHPTLGSAFTALEGKRIFPTDGKIIQECGVGLVTLHVEDAHLSLTLPEPKLKAVIEETISEIEAILGHSVSTTASPVTVNTGIIWIVAYIPDAKDVLNIKPNLERLTDLSHKLNITGVTVFGDKEQSGEIEVRTFAPACGIEEDPVCGSENGSVAAFWQHYKLLEKQETTYIPSQGQKVGRNGKITVNYSEDGQISIGGSCITTVDGKLNI